MATINVPKSQPYLLWNYLHLGKLNDNKKGVAYQRSKKNVFLYKECIVEFEPNYNKKIYFFLVTINLLKF